MQITSSNTAQQNRRPVAVRNTAPQIVQRKIQLPVDFNKEVALTQCAVIAGQINAIAVLLNSRETMVTIGADAKSESETVFIRHGWLLERRALIVKRVEPRRRYWLEELNLRIAWRAAYVPSCGELLVKSDSGLGFIATELVKLRVLGMRFDFTVTAQAQVHVTSDKDAAKALRAAEEEMDDWSQGTDADRELCRALAPWHPGLGYVSGILVEDAKGLPSVSPANGDPILHDPPVQILERHVRGLPQVSATA